MKDYIFYSRRVRMKELADKTREKIYAIMEGTADNPDHELRQLMTLTRKLRDEVTDLYDKRREHEEVL